MVSIQANLKINCPSRNITPGAQSLLTKLCMISEVLMMVTIKTAVLWDIMLCI